MAETDNRINIVDDEGKERQCEVLFTYQNPETKIDYVVFYDASDLEEDNDNEELDVFAYRYVLDESGKVGELFALETDEEIEMINEVIDSYYKDSLDVEEE